MIVPLRDHAIVRVQHNDSVGKSGLVWHTKRVYIGSADDGYAYLHAVVESVGPGKYIKRGDREGQHAGMDVRRGDRVLIGRFAGKDLDLERDADIRLVRGNEILMVEGEDAV